MWQMLKSCMLQVSINESTVFPTGVILWCLYSLYCLCLGFPLISEVSLKRTCSNLVAQYRLIFLVGHGGSRSCFTIKLLSAFKTFSSQKCSRVLRFILSVQVNLFGHLVVLAGNPLSVLSLKKRVHSKISNKEDSFWRLILKQKRQYHHQQHRRRQDDRGLDERNQDDRCWTYSGHQHSS